MKLAVLLASRLDPDAYSSAYERGDGPDRYPYGLENVSDDVEVTLSSPSEHSRVPARIRNRLTRLLVADIVHAFRNREMLRSADAIYAHTEHEYLAAAAILLLYRSRSVCLSGQTIWLFETFADMPRWRKAIVGRLLRRVDVFIYNAEPNVAAGRSIAPRSEHVYLPFGVSKVFATVERRQPGERPLVLSVGIDRSRDWACLAAALDGIDADVRIAARAEIAQLSQAIVCPTENFGELLDLYGRATCVVLALHPNLHASGITTVLEAASAGVPVVATAAGGLTAYFAEGEVSFVPPGDAAALRAAVDRLIGDAGERARCSTAIKDAYLTRALDSTSYWARVVATLRPCT